LGPLTHQEQLHQVAIDGWCSRLHEEDVGAADGLAEAAIRLVVREGLKLDLAELDAELVADPVREPRVRPAREHHQALLRPALDEVAWPRLRSDRRPLEAGQRGELSRLHDGWRILPCL